MLPPFWRFAVRNETGVTLSNLEITWRQWKFDANGALTWSTEQSQDGGIATSTFATGSYDSETNLKDNTTDLYLGLHGRFRGVMPGTGSPDGDLILYLEWNSSTDESEVDAEMADRGIVIAKIYFSAVSQDYAVPFEV